MHLKKDYNVRYTFRTLRFPTLLCALIATPCSIKYCTTDSLPNSEAFIKAVSPFYVTIICILNTKLL